MFISNLRNAASFAFASSSNLFHSVRYNIMQSACAVDSTSGSTSIHTLSYTVTTLATVHLDTVCNAFTSEEEEKGKKDSRKEHYTNEILNLNVFACSRSIQVCLSNYLSREIVGKYQKYYTNFTNSMLPCFL